MKLFVTLVVAAILAAPALSSQSKQAGGAYEAASSNDDLKPIPAISLVDFEGKKITAEALKGNIIVLDFWATWCAPCIAEVPALNRLQEKYGDRGVKVVGVTMASGDVAEVKPVVARSKMKYTIYMGDDEQAYDFNIFAFPTTYILTRDLKIFKKYIGTGPAKASQMEADIQKLLDQR